MPIHHQNETSLVRALLTPESVAIVGASDDPTKTTARPQQFLAQAGYTGNAYFVNPRRETVQGVRAYPSLSALPEVPEHVYIMTGAEAAIETVRECAHLGVTTATVLASGFAEEGPAGRAREDRLRAAAAEGEVRVVGPSSLGVVNPRNGVMLTGNAAFGEPDLPTGGIFVASQSGSVIGSLVSRARGRGMGFAGLVSVGGEADLSLGEICTAAVDDPGVTSFALFLESLRHSNDLVTFARKAARAGKPVAVYKLGRSDEAANLTVSHTGALAGEDSEADALFRACGFARVEHFESLLEAPNLLLRLGDGPRAHHPRIGVVTTTGGGAAIMVDQLAIRGMRVTAPSDALVGEMNAAGAHIPHSLIADLGLAGARHDVVTTALQHLQDSGEFDLIVFVIGSSARLNPELAVEAISERGGYDVPIVGFALPEAPEAAELLNASGVPAFRTPESCADVVAAAYSRRPPALHDGFRVGSVEVSASEVLDELASTQLLSQAGIHPVEYVALTPEEIADPDLALPFPFPVVAKALSADVPHKSDVGGVVLDVADIGELRAAAAQILSSVRNAMPTARIDKILVQRMQAKAVTEALVGYRVTRDVGPLVVLSTGGVMAELFSDSSVRLAPIDADTAREMISEVKGLSVATGYRGLPRGDIEALVDAMVNMSRLAVTAPDVLEAEVNPLSIGRDGDGVTALDALVRRAVPNTEASAVSVVTSAQAAVGAH
ncbi:MAG TPA: acetate--CoA ligase family protein [Flexivirga sp.]|uniref:acetate--CoA ligase family protein n=1 Tax=Flexivirga sp. TaxID=1962927 RepID=UPI002C1E79EE|nr:acetate--CoA ligase family protein [Flexivirga sp.]HWC22743.1 acetate--CoA ligase family protein [Flexivirga sp.]